MTETYECVVCGEPTTEYDKNFCASCDGATEPKPVVKTWVRCVRCHTHEAMPGRKVCEGCAD